MTTSSNISIKLGDWLIEPERNRLSCADEEKKLDPRALDVLVYLAKAAPRTVSQDELLDRFWQGRVVEGSTVHRVISRIRSALDDKAKGARYIETVPKRGYRVVGPVQCVAPAAPKIASPQMTKTEFLDLPRARAALVEESEVLQLGRVEITKGRWSLGRGEDNDLVLADGSISHRHARISLGSAGWRIEDLGSTNGLYVNDTFLNDAVLNDGDLIQLGRLSLRFTLS